MRYLRFCLALALGIASLILFSNAHAFEGLNATVHDGVLRFQTPSITFTGGQPRVVVLSKAGAEPVTLQAQNLKQSGSTADRQTPAGPATTRTFQWKDARGYEMTWTVCALKERPGFTLQMTFANQSRQPVRLREFGLSHSGKRGLKAAGTPADWFLSTLDSHDSSIGGFNPSGTLATEAERRFLDVLTLYTDRGAKGLIISAVGPAESDVRFRCHVAKGAMGLEVVSEMNDVVVDPGETRRSEEVLVLAEPHGTAIPTMFRWLAATHGSRTARGPIAGWCSWYSGRGKNVNHEHITEVCSALGTAQDQLPLQVIQIDDGWEKAYGDWEVDLTKFPQGLKPVADQIRAAGAIPGVWLCPVRSSSEGAHPDGQKNEYLDPSNPAVKAYVRKILTDRVADGFRYFKLDFLWVRNLDTRYDQKKTRLQISRDLYKIYRESVGEDSYLSACVGGLNRSCYGFADAARIGTDISGSMKTLYSGVSMVDCINATGSTAEANGILFANDPDCTYTHFSKNNGDALRTWHSFTGLLGGVMMTSDMLHRNKPAQLRAMDILMPPAPEKGVAFDGQTDPYHRRFGFVAKRPWGNFASVLLWNPEEKPANVSLAGVPLEEIGKKFHVWSFWDERYLGVADKGFIAKQLPRHGCALLRLTALPQDASQPVLVGSSLHIGMGSAEIEAVQYSKGQTTILLKDAGARSGSLVIYSPRPLALAKAEGCQATVASKEPNLWTLTLTERPRGISGRIELTVGDVK